MPLSAPTNLPTGTATFLFTDIQGSTQLVQALGTERWRELLGTHYALLREAFASNRGQEVNTEGDAFFVVFASAADAVRACVEGQRALAAHEWPADAAIRVRMGLHTGEAELVGGDYMGFDIHRAARVAATGHGGQVVLSDPTRVLVEHALPEGVGLRDLGEHRLKDLARRERLWQLTIPGLASDFPPLKSLDFTPNNLPTQLTSFVGRDRELAQAKELLGKTRLLTLTGPGGTGKTRLSLQLAAEASDGFADGVYWVPLAPITDPELVPNAIIQSLGLQESGNLTARDVLLAHVKERQLLLVLDNFEQILDAAPAVAEILQTGPQVKAIASSRSPLRVYGEQEYAVPPLGVPDGSKVATVESLSQFESVKLFIERAVAVKPDFEVTNENAPAVAQITALVDGLPLAVELAAARIRLMNPQAMLARLEGRLGDLGGGSRDLPARQQTLRGAIAWSYDLLDETQRRLFAHFAVFTGGASLSHVERVCGEHEGDVDILEGLETLVEHSLLRPVDDPDEARFLMLHVIREYALERLEERDDASEVRQRHAEAYLGEVEDAAPHLLASDSKRWLDHLDIEQANIRAAMDWFVKTDQAQPALKLAWAAWRFWQIRGHISEGIARAEEAVALPGAAEHAGELMRAYEALGGLEWWRGVDTERCYDWYEKALELARVAGTKEELADALYNITFPTQYSARGGGSEAADIAERVKAQYEEARALYRELGARDKELRAAWGLSQVHQFIGQWDKSVELMEGSGAESYFRDKGATFDLIWTLHTLGQGTSRTGQLERSRAVLREGMTLLRDTRDVSGIAIYLEDFADLELVSGHPERAARLLGASAAARESTGVGISQQSTNFQRLDPLDYMTQAELDAALAAGGRMSLDEAIEYALGS